MLTCRILKDNMRSEICFHCLKVISKGSPRLKTYASSNRLIVGIHLNCGVKLFDLETKQLLEYIAKNGNGKRKL